MRVIVLGGAGNFGGRIVRGLQQDANIELVSAGRRTGLVPGATNVRSVRLDIAAPGLETTLRALSPDLVIHCVGPFQGQDYRVAKAALGAGSHYLDLADGRNFVTEFARNVHEAAIAANRLAVCGASTLPALSSAVLAELRQGLSNVESVDLVIAPGQRAIRGTATLESVFSYLGKPFPIWRDGRWAQAWGWMDLRWVDLDVGKRLAAACDVPDLALLPVRFPEIRSVRFHAALEFTVQHLALWCLAGIRRVGLPVPVGLWAGWLDRWAAAFDPIAADRGGMAVTITGRHNEGRRVRRTWQLVAPAADGPEIPCMAAILLTRQLAGGASLPSGAFACMGFLRLADFEPLFARWRITTRTEESAA
jgi:hypothetical protein